MNRVSIGKPVDENAEQIFEKYNEELLNIFERIENDIELSYSGKIAVIASLTTAVINFFFKNENAVFFQIIERAKSYDHYRDLS